MSWTPPRSIRDAVHRNKCAMVSRTSIVPKKAAKRVGRSKSAILKAIREGRISATKSDSGSWHIEPVELFRAYPDRGSESTQPPHTSAPNVRSEEHTSELQSLMRISYAVFCLKKKKKKQNKRNTLELITENT